MSYNLFLDDLRDPKNAYITSTEDVCGTIMIGKSLETVSGISNDDWFIVRNYEDFVSVIEKDGLPDAVSFDHDLHYEHIKHYYKVTESTGVIEYGNLKHKTGKHCAEYLAQRCTELQPQLPPKVFVHSANKYGAIEINKVLSQIYHFCN
jgi:hypothetical protein